MAVTSFKYATISDLANYFNDYKSFDKKTQIFSWEETGTPNLYLARNAGLVSILFADGEDLGDPEANSGVVNVNGEWYYDSALDTVYYFNSATNPNDMLMESGKDFTDYMNQQLTNASLELHSFLDARYPSPLPKSQQVSEASSTSINVEYDPLIIKMTCYICASNLIRAKNAQDELANYYMDLVSNADGTGFADRLSKGDLKLSFEVDKKDSIGSIREITRSGSMYLVETAGAWTGEPFDIVRITCTTAGVFGTCKVKIETHNGDKLFGSEDTNVDVTGGLDYIIHGLYVRFAGNSLSENDQWEIPVFNVLRKQSNSSFDSISLTRQGKRA